MEGQHISLVLKMVTPAANVRVLLITQNALQAKTISPSSPLCLYVIQDPKPSCAANIQSDPQPRNSLSIKGNASLVGVLALGIRIVVLNEAAIAIVVFLVVCCGHPSHAMRTPRDLCIALCRLLRNSIAGIDPIGVDVDGGAQVVDIGLEGLAADFALQVADARLLLNGYADGVLVVAEEALEGCGELLLLWDSSV